MVIPARDYLRQIQANLTNSLLRHLIK